MSPCWSHLSSLAYVTCKITRLRSKSANYSVKPPTILWRQILLKHSYTHSLAYCLWLHLHWTAERRSWQTHKATINSIWPFKKKMCWLMGQTGNSRVHPATSIPHFIALHFIALCRFFFFQIEGLWQHRKEHVHLHDFFNSICSLHVLCHILIILTVLQKFSLFLSLLWWSVISYFWCYFCNCLGAPRTSPT